MSAPSKPWETSGPGGSRTFQMPASVDQNLPGQISGINASQPAALLGPPPVPGRPRRRAPPAPVAAPLVPRSYGPSPALQSSMPGATYGNTYPNTYGTNTYGNSTYGGAYGNTYASTYGSSLGGAYGSTLGGSYGSPYSGYGTGYGMAGGYGGYGQRFGGYGMSPYGNQPPMNSLESRLVALAEERSRPAFESIGSVVQTVGSVSFMLESTLAALHSSFRAILAVADHVGRLRALFSAMAVFRLARGLHRRLMHMLGLAPERGEEAAWAAAGAGDVPSGASWPVAAFVAVVMAAPYLAYRLLSSLAPPEKPTAEAGPAQANHLQAWMSSGQPVGQATSKFDFAPQAAGELAVRAHQQVFLAPRQMQTFHNGWILASDGNSSGLVPKAYLGQSGHAAPRTQPVKPTAPSFEPKISVVAMEPDIFRQGGQPEKGGLAE